MYFEIFDLAQPLTLAIVLQSVVLLVVALSFNYLSLTVPPYFVYWRKAKEQVNATRLQEVSVKPEQIKREMFWSFVNILISSVLTVGVIIAWRQGVFPQFYLSIDQYGWAYFFFSIVLIILVQDGLFYFVHRLLHTRKFIRFHAIHHRSKVPTSFSMYTYHPVEGLMHFVRLPLVITLFPVCPLTLLITEGFISNVINAYSHLNHEPRWLRFIRPIHGRSAGTATVHDLHHAQGKGNFGFYLKFWDDVFGTRLPETDQRVASIHQNWQETA